MKSVLFTACAAALASLSSASAIPVAALEKRDDYESKDYDWPGDCNTDGPWSWTERVGPNTGSPWCEFNWVDGGTHSFISGFDFWWERDFGIKGIKVYYSDGDSGRIQMHGVEGENKDSFSIEKGDTVSKLNLWGDGSGTRLGVIEIATTGGGYLITGFSHTPDDETKLDLKSGYLVGVVGGQGEAIDNIGFIFLNSGVKSILEDDMKYPDLPTNPDDASISAYTVLEETFGNGMKDKSISVTVTAQESHVATTVTQSTTAHMWQDVVTVTLKGTLAKVVELSGSNAFTWQQSTTAMNSFTNSQTFTATIAATIPLDPGHGVHCVLSYAYGEGEFDYTSHITATFEDGNTLGWDSDGSVKVQSYMQAKGSCEDEDDKSKWGASDTSSIQALAAEGVLTVKET